VWPPSWCPKVKMSTWGWSLVDILCLDSKFGIHVICHHFYRTTVMLAWYMLSSSVCVTSWHCTKTAKRWIAQITPCDKTWPRHSSFLMPKISAKFSDGHALNANGGAKYRWVRFKLAIFDQYLAMSQKRCKIGT